jgi:hypothetical protein
MAETTAFEIKEHYEGLKTKLLTQTFDLRAEAGEVDVSVDGGVRDRLSAREFAGTQAAEAANAVDEMRNGMKAEYEELDLEMRAALEARGEVIEEQLRPQNASFADLVAAADANTDALKTAFDVAGEDGQKVALAVARERDNEELFAHIVSHREDWADLLAELEIISSEPEFPADEAFEQFAQPAPSKPEILGARPSDINQTGMLR